MEEAVSDNIRRPLYTFKWVYVYCVILCANKVYIYIVLNCIELQSLKPSLIKDWVLKHDVSVALSTEKKIKIKKIKTPPAEKANQKSEKLQTRRWREIG